MRGFDNHAPKCRHEHRLKQDPRWKVEQITPATFRWTTPADQRQDSRFCCTAHRQAAYRARRRDRPLPEPVVVAEVKPRKPRAPHVTPEQRGEIHELAAAGVKVPEIVARFGLSQPAVYRHLGLPCAAAGTCAVCPVAGRAEAAR
jgi:hypothetical protein